MSNNHRFVFTHLGEMISINNPEEMTRALNQAPGVLRATNPIEFLLKNVGWAVLEHLSMDTAAIKFYEQNISRSAVRKLLAALFERMVIHSNFNVLIYTRGVSSKLFTRMPASECVDFLREILKDRETVSVNSVPISQSKLEVSEVPLIRAVMERITQSRHPTEDIFSIANDAGLNVGEITTYYADTDAERFFFNHIGSSVQERMGLPDKVVATEYLGRPIERAMDPESSLSLSGVLRETLSARQTSVHECQMEIQGTPYTYKRAIMPVRSKAMSSGGTDYIISILSDVRHAQ